MLDSKVDREKFPIVGSVFRLGCCELLGKEGKKLPLIIDELLESCANCGV
jgi:hypothetical protein